MRLRLLAPFRSDLSIESVFGMKPPGGKEPPQPDEEGTEDPEPSEEDGKATGAKPGEATAA